MWSQPSTRNRCHYSKKYNGNRRIFDVTGTVVTFGDIETVITSNGGGSAGSQGVSGKDGYTPVKGVDYFDGKDGKETVKS